MTLKKSLLGAVAALFYSSAAFAACTVNSVPQVGVICDIARNPTYSAAAVGLVPAASATDIACIAASATKSIAIRRISVAGTAGTAITTPALIYRRATADTGGTPATLLALPVGVPHSTNDPASTATLVSYTANPTITDTAPSLMDVLTVDLPVTTAAGGNIEAMHTYGTGSVDLLSKGIDLAKASTQQVCVNLNAVSVSSGVVNINFEWTEQ